MSTKENKSQIYIKSTRQWVPVSEEFHKAYFREIDLFRRKQIRRQCCNCPASKWWLCDMNCDECEFRCHPGNMISIDAEIGEGDDACPLADVIPDGTQNLEETLMLGELLDTLHEELDYLDPEGKRIWELFMQGHSEREASDIMGMARSTFKRHWAKIQSELYEKLKDYYI